jgi:hypothetical protein
MLQFRRPGRGRYRARLRRPGKYLHGVKFFLLLGLLGTALALVTHLPVNGLLGTVAADPPAPYTQPPTQPAAAVPGPLDEPLRLVSAAAQTYQQVRDYTCTMIKQERLKGRLQPENVIYLKFRQQPFSVYMRWAAPQSFAGQEVAFVYGKNNNMMRVHSTGVIGALGWVSISPRDPRALEHSRHTITETGIGNLIGQLYQEWMRVRTSGKVQVHLAEYQYDRRPCTRVEIIYLDRSQQSYCYRGVIYFDKQNHLPVRVEFYDWPRAGGPAGGDLLESFSYANLQLNVGLNDANFNY